MQPVVIFLCVLSTFLAFGAGSPNGLTLREHQSDVRKEPNDLIMEGKELGKLLFIL